MEQRNIMLDVVRGVAIMIVVFAHALQGCYAMDWTHPVHRVIHLFQMPLLMAISGYAACYAGRYGWWGDVHKKFVRLFLPSTVWSLISVGLTALLLGGVALKGVVYSPFFWPFWFLRELFWIFLVYLTAVYLLDMIFRKIELCVAWWVRFAAVVVISFALMHLLSLVHLCGTWWLYYFFGGMMVFHLITTYKLRRSLFWLGGLLFIGQLPILIVNYHGTYPFWSRLWLGYTLSIACVWSVWFFFQWQPAQRIVPIIAYVGRRSLSIYAIHWCLFFYTRICHLERVVKVAGFWPSIAATFVVWLLGSLLLDRLLQRSNVARLVLLGESTSKRGVRHD